MVKGPGEPSRKRRGRPIARHIDEDVRRRFWAKVRRGGPGECWLWTAAMNEAGNGVFVVDDALMSAARVAWVIAHGDPPPGMVVYQANDTCVSRACVNPAHHAVGTYADRTAAQTRRGTKYEHRATGTGHRFVPAKEEEAR